jgi:hypothetical protein
MHSSNGRKNYKAHLDVERFVDECRSSLKEQAAQ